MNTDRFLTRVFDKQEKKMLYSLHADFIGIGNDCFTRTNREGIEVILFKDRFVPMQCLGNTDKNKKLIYSADIVATSNNKYLVYREEESAAFWFKRLDNECEILIDDFSCEIEIIGNRWENEKLWEVKA